MNNKTKSSETTNTYKIKDIFSTENILLEEILKKLFVKQITDKM